MNKEVSQEDKYIIDESQEISVGEAEGWVHHILSAFPPFAYRNYQIWFSGQFTSLIGTWIQTIAQGWLVLQLTNSALWVGTIAALNFLPVLLFGLWGGVIVDRFPKKRLLFITQFLSMTCAFILGILTILNVVNVYHIAAIALVLGIVGTVDMPVRQSLAVELVGKEHLSSALALNSGTFNAARVIGPAFAGILIATVGIGGSFIINGISFMAVLIALFFIKIKERPYMVHPHPIKAIKEGIKYALSHSTIKMLLIFAGITSIFGWSYSIILPVIVKDIFHLGAAELGYFSAASGLGALVGAIIVSSNSKKIKPMRFMIAGSLMFSLALILFSYTSIVWIAMLLLFFSGLGILMQYTMINSTIQHMVDDSVRGRVMSIYVMMFAGMQPFAGFQVGYIAEHLGPEMAIRIGAFVVLAFALFLYAYRKKLLPKPKLNPSYVNA